MKKQAIEQNWWSALSDWLGKHQGRADFLFVYDRELARLDRCFDRNVALNTVDMATVSKLYRAAAEGRLGLLWPNNLKPQLLTTDPKKLFATGKEASSVAESVPTAEESVSEKTEQERTEAKPQERAGDGAEPEMIPGLDARSLERISADPVVAGQLHEAQMQYRQVMYVPEKIEKPLETEASDGENPVAGARMKRAATVEQAVEMLQNALPLDAFGNKQEQLAADLVQMILTGEESYTQDKKQRERRRRAREELITAQNLFIWAAASDARDQKAYEARLEWLEQEEKWATDQARRDQEWKEQMGAMSRELHNMDRAGASEQACNEKIRDYLDGKRPVRKPGEGADADRQQESPEASGEMWGSALRHFCRFAASEVPLSTRHVQVAEQCQKILKQTQEMGLNIEDLGLDPQERMVVKGTIEMGALVARGLMAQAALSSGQRLPGKQYRECLRSYLAMKGIEETLIPHVQAHQKEIDSGDGPISALQILMANRGFHADDLRNKAGRTEAMALLERMDPVMVAQMIRHGGDELAAMGRQVMIASCQMSDAPQSVREPQAPQMSGPAR